MARRAANNRLGLVCLGHLLAAGQDSPAVAQPVDIAAVANCPGGHIHEMIEGLVAAMPHMIGGSPAAGGLLVGLEPVGYCQLRGCFLALEGGDSLP